MPEEPKKATEVKEEKTIDLDTSGPDVEVTLPEEKDKSVSPSISLSVSISGSILYLVDCSFNICDSISLCT